MEGIIIQPFGTATTMKGKFVQHEEAMANSGGLSELALEVDFWRLTDERDGPARRGDHYEHKTFFLRARAGDCFSGEAPAAARDDEEASEDDY